jgi:hypothetical protein
MNGNIRPDIPNVNGARISIIISHFMSPLKSGTNGPKKNSVQENPYLTPVFVAPLEWIKFILIIDTP